MSALLIWAVEVTVMLAKTLSQRDTKEMQANVPSSFSRATGEALSASFTSSDGIVYSVELGRLLRS